MKPRKPRQSITAAERTKVTAWVLRNQEQIAQMVEDGRIYAYIAEEIGTNPLNRR